MLYLKSYSIVFNMLLNTNAIGINVLHSLKEHIELFIYLYLDWDLLLLT